MKRSQKKIAAILQAGRKSFLKHGFDGSNMHDIAILANVSKRTLYHRFPDKNLLFQAVLQDHWDRMISKSKISLRENESPKTFLKRFAKFYLSFLYKPETRAIFRLLIAESAHFPQVIQKVINRNRPNYTKIFIEYLTEQQKRGIFKINDFQLATSQFFGLLKENQFWASLVGLKPKIDKSKTSMIINSAVNIFLAAYQKK